VPLENRIEIKFKYENPSDEWLDGEKKGQV
jgi:hypothetical protein